MAQITFKGDPVQTSGSLPAVGQKAPEFSVVDTALNTVKLSDFAGKKVVLNVFPSVDTGVCALQLKAFNEKVAGNNDVVLLFVSLDLPFAFKRFCGAESVNNAVTASDFRGCLTSHTQSFIQSLFLRLLRSQIMMRQCLH